MIVLVFITSTSSALAAWLLAARRRRALKKIFREIRWGVRDILAIIIRLVKDKYAVIYNQISQ
jgi:hypothetical protein